MRPTAKKLKRRILSLSEKNQAQWGKMTVYQMMKHCTIWEGMMLGHKQYKRVFMGRLFGKMALRSILKDESPLRRSTPTLPELIITGSGDVESEKLKWLDLISEYEKFSDRNFVHPFFGTMTTEQIGYLVYKHGDHHLRQFNA